MSTKVYYQHTEAHDWTYMPDSTTLSMEMGLKYDTDTWGITNALTKTLGRHDLLKSAVSTGWHRCFRSWKT